MAHTSLTALSDTRLGDILSAKINSSLDIGIHVDAFSPVFVKHKHEFIPKRNTLGSNALADFFHPIPNLKSEFNKEIPNKLSALCEEEFCSFFLIDVFELCPNGYVDFSFFGFINVRSKFFKPRKPVHEFCLSVAVNTGNTHDFARVNGERNVLDRFFFVDFVANAQSFYVQKFFFGLCLVFIHGKFDGMSDHHCGKLFFGRIRNVDSADILAFAQNRATVRNRHNLVEFVRDEKD